MPITNIPYAGTLDTAHTNPPWNMDVMHIQQLYRLCERIRPRVVVEVGSYMGASTSAFVEAMRDGFVQELTCYDINPTKELSAVLDAGMDHGRMGVCQVPYPHQPIYADLIFIDGDHERGALHDTLAALCMGCPHIVMHDSNALHVGMGCRGVADSVACLKAVPGRVWHEDIVKRPGLFTHRGLFYSSADALNPGWHVGDLP